MNTAPSIWPALLAFVVVIALIPAVMWVLKRLQGGLQAGGRGIALIGGLALGPRERVALIEVQGRRFLVGVTAQSVNLIAEVQTEPNSPGASQGASQGSGSGISGQSSLLADPVDPAPALTPTAAGFADLLSRLKRP
ncbi:MAG: flagellar biosynthetic protein FliO [Burkholderiales bacterium]